MKVGTGTNNLTKHTSSSNSLSLKAKATLKTIQLGIQALCSATLCKHIMLSLLANSQLSAFLSTHDPKSTDEGIWGEKNLRTAYLEQEKVLCKEAKSAEDFHHCTQKQKSKFYQLHKLSATYILVPDAESVISGGDNYLILCVK